MRLDDLLIGLSYCSIPLQLVVYLYQYPHLGSLPKKLVGLFWVMFFFLEATGFSYLIRSWSQHTDDDTLTYTILNSLTCLLSIVTAAYGIPCLLSGLNDLDASFQDLSQACEEAEASKRKLFTFMSFLCHEIRNPLFAITSNIEFAQDMDMTPDLEESLQSIHQSAQLMLRLVNDVLDLSKIESGKLELEEHEFNIRDFFQNLASTFSSQIQRKRQGEVEFVFNMAHSLPRIVQSDSVRVLQIAYNILSNACKFTEQGTITFSVSLVDDNNNSSKQKRAKTLKKRRRRSRPSLKGCDSPRSVMEDLSGSDRNMLLGSSHHESNSDAAFSMALLEEGVSAPPVRDEQDDDCTTRVLKMTFEDTGKGIAPDQLAKIFQPYAQSTLSDSRKHGGTGLGLSIICKLLDMMGGTVQVSSVLQEGSKFVVLLPIRVPRRQKQIRKRNSFAKLEESPNMDVTGLAAIEVAAETHITATPLEATPVVASVIPACPEHGDSCPLKSWKRQSSSSSDSSTSTTSASSFSNDAPPTSVDLFSSSSPQPPSATSSCSIVPTKQPATSSSLILSSTPRPKQPSIIRPIPSSSKPTLGKFQFPKNTNLVLVVDDNAVNRKLIGKMLSFFHVEYQTAQHGQEALQIMQQSRNYTSNPAAPHYGLVLMDLCMPVMDGYEAIAGLRSLGFTLPIVALTANAMAEEKRKTLEAGATDFATKPILRNVLHATCVQHLGSTA